MRLIGALAPLLLLSAALADGNNEITVASIERSGTVDNNKNVQHLAEEQGQGKLRHLLKKLSLRMGVGVQGGCPPRSRRGEGGRCYYRIFAQSSRNGDFSRND